MRIDLRLSTEDAARLMDLKKESKTSTSETIRLLIRKRSGKNPEKIRMPSRTRETNGKKYSKNPLVSPKGELDYFSELFKSRPQYDNPNFKIAWNSFVAMRSDPKTNPAPVSDRAAERFARVFEDFSVEAAIRALIDSTLNEWAGIFPKEERPRFDDEDPGPWDLPKRFTDRR